MRGKPKGIRRKEAVQRHDVIEKLQVSLRGDIASFDEWTPCEDIRYLAALRDTLPKREARRLERLMEHWAALHTIQAVVEGDAEFFDRMAKIARFNKSGRRPVDLIGAWVSAAGIHLRRNGEKVTTRRVIGYIERAQKRKGANARLKDLVLDEGNVGQLVRAFFSKGE
ncbi:MAG: hypothetical protein WDO13_06165 [Verrucomicrobiota bacterium]